ncbi:MAG TPA: hypothetical protein VEK56_02695 [Vicinamibacterales bacterium]|nr:hypothetical protein [Vicinamibacterales bacterium]
MPACSVDLPVNIPWKLIAASADMMDTRFCNKRFPFAWRSSLALSVYEPLIEDLPDGLCAQRLTYLKLTCSITGYQPTKEETDQIVDAFPDQPTEDQRAALDRILAEYFACYGVLLNVAVFPGRHKVRKEATIDFARIPDARPGSVLPNPHEIGGVKFEADGVPENHLIDIFPAGGDSLAELDLNKRMTISFPPGLNVARVEARVVHFSASGVSLEAFKGTTSLGTKAAGSAQNTVHALVLEADGIERVVLSAPDNQASLLEFKYGIAAGESEDNRDIALDDFPHIIDFEPKVRDLYQAATETGEVLAGSKSGIKTDKSFTHTESTQHSFSAGVKVPIPSTPAVGEISASRTTTDADQTQWAVQADASRERRETQSTSTQISQMYNLLTGYHVGTNRATFLMLARPHILQPTDLRTFVQGLRAIEGIQEFFLIVSRPQEMDGLCVEAWLETGHFPEDVQIKEPAPEYEESFEDFPVTKSADSGLFSKKCTSIETQYTIGSGWVIDRRPQRGPDPGHPGMKMIDDRSNEQAKDSLHDYSYGPASDASVSVLGEICGSRNPFSDDASFDRTYRVFMRSEQAKPTHQQPSADVERLLITARELCVCFRSKDGCPEVVSRPERRIRPEKAIVDEPIISMNTALLTREARSESRAPTTMTFLHGIERAMSNSWRMPRRYPLGEVGFLDSDFFKERMKRALPPEILRRPLSAVPDVPPGLAESLGPQTSVDEALKLDLSQLARRTGLSVKEAGDLRKKLLRIPPDEASGRK